MAELRPPTLSSHSIVIPLEQGLRLFTLPNENNFVDSIVIPLEQGLRPIALASNLWHRKFYRHSIRTRIKTL